MKKSLLSLLALLLLFVFTACGAQDEEDPQIESDSDQSYVTGVTAKTDTKVYVITGQVVGEVNQLVRQVKPAQGSISGPSCYGTSGCYGSTTGSFSGEEVKGKGMVRILVQSAEPKTDSAPVGDVVILKVTDTKATTALLAGDKVTFKCRRQFEALAAVKENQKLDEDGKDEIATWEMDYCRMATPVVKVVPQ